MAKVIWNDKKVKEHARHKLADRLKRIGFAIEGDAKRMCPVDTGRLRASITTNWTGSGRSRAEVKKPAKAEDGIGEPGGSKKKFMVVVGTNVEYGTYVEYGASGKSAQPYLRPALRKNFKGK